MNARACRVHIRHGQILAGSPPCQVRFQTARFETVARTAKRASRSDGLSTETTRISSVSLGAGGTSALAAGRERDEGPATARVARARPFRCMSFARTATGD